MPHANHVLQKFIKILPPCEVQFVIDEIVQPTNGAFVAAAHEYGCRIVLRLLEYCRPSQLLPLVNMIMPGVSHLSMHKFGQYVFQALVDFASLHSFDPVWGQIKKECIDGFTLRVWNRAGQTPASILERVLDACEGSQLNSLCHALLDGNSNLLAMCCKNKMHRSAISELMLENVDTETRAVAFFAFFAFFSKK